MFKKDNVKFTRAQNQKKVAKLSSISEKLTNNIKNLNEKDQTLSREVKEMRLTKTNRLIFNFKRFKIYLS
jgi:hypothetical protein